jgi:hypothetical protein
MGIECAYSFEDLYRAAYGKSLSLKEKNKLQNISQEKINSLVLAWAEKAGWKTNKKIGKDNKIYLSFYPRETA